MKRKHANAGPTRKHECNRCHRHKRKVTMFRKKTGRRFVLCDDCKRAVSA